MNDATRPQSRVMAVRAGALCLLLGNALVGCYMPPPVTHAQLSVSQTGTYTLDEQAVAATELARALAAKRASAANLRVDLHASPQAEMKAIEFAVAAAREAQVKVDFTHDLSAEAMARLQAEAASAPPR